MKQVLLDARAEGREVYHRRDSHWNYLGALIGSSAILDSLGRDHENWLDAPCTVERTWRGDLDKLLYPAGGTLDDQYVFDVRFSDFRFNSIDCFLRCVQPFINAADNMLHLVIKGNALT